MAQITKKCLGQLVARAAENGIQLTLPEELAEHICTERKNGDSARQMRRLVQEKVEGPLVAYLLRCSKKPSKIWAKWTDGSLSFRS